MLQYPVILAITIVGIVVLSAIVYLATGTIFSVVVLLLLAGAVGYLLDLFGVLSIKNSAQGLSIDFHENAPAPHEKQVKQKPIETKEVFYVEGNDFTYNDAAPLCAAYNAELATYDQVSDAFARGAEWCGYGWSQGGMALFPTQESTWNLMQKELDETKRTVCGRPGVNGGYFDPKLKFGVNCYGVKPNGKVHLPLPVPGTDPSAFNKMVDKFKKMLAGLSLSPFNRDVWSEKGELKHEASEAKKKAVSFVGGLEKDVMHVGSEIENAF
jgi:hypothetical protein